MNRRGLLVSSCISILVLAAALVGGKSLSLVEQESHKEPASPPVVHPFSSPPSVCWLGDSRTDLSTIEVPGTVIWSMGSYVGWLRWSFGARMQTDEGRVLGKSAMKSDHWLRVQVPEAISLGCNITVSQIGSNDITDGVAADQIISNITSGVTMLERAGVVSVFVAVIPTDRWIARQLRAADKFNDQLRHVATDSRGSVIFADARIQMVDPGTGRVRQGFLVDGVHDTSQGAAALAASVSPALDALLPKETERSGTGNRQSSLIDGDFSEPGGVLRGGAAGVAPKAWKCGPLDDRAATVEAHCGVKSNQALLSITGTGDGKAIGFSQTVPVVGKAGLESRYALKCKLSWTGGNGLIAVAGALTTNVGGASYRAEDGDGARKNDGGLVPGSFPEKGKAEMATPVLVLPAGAHTVTASIFVRTVVGGPVSAQLQATGCSLQ